MTVTRNPLSILTTTAKDAVGLLRGVKEASSSLAPIRQAAWWRIALLSPVLLLIALFVLALVLFAFGIFLVLNVLAWPFKMFGGAIDPRNHN